MRVSKKLLKSLLKDAAILNKKIYFVGLKFLRNIFNFPDFPLHKQKSSSKLE
jgi:hypothetical protein